MAKLIPETFPDPGTDSLTNFNFIDIASGRGYVQFYGGVMRGAQLSGAGILSGAVISNSTFASEPVYQRIRHNTTAENTTFSHQFDAEFLKPLIIEGKAVVSQPMQYL